MNREKETAQRRRRRQLRVRRRTRGTSERPRLSVFRSHKHVACQIIDDTTGRTLCAASTRDGQLRDSIKYGGNRQAAVLVGKTIAERALDAGIKAVVLDRGSHRYHGRVAALADAAREAGLSL